jgi:hypothetical protein
VEEIVGPATSGVRIEISIACKGVGVDDAAVMFGTGCGGELKAARPEVLVAGVRGARPLAPGTVAFWNGSFLVKSGYPSTAPSLPL